MAAQELLLFQDHRETGFDGMYESTTSYRLLIGEAKRTALATVTLEIEAETRTGREPSEREIARYEIGVEDLVRLIEKAGKRVAAS